MYCSEWKHTLAVWSWVFKHFCRHCQRLIYKEPLDIHMSLLKHKDQNCHLSLNSLHCLVWVLASVK